MQNTELAGRVRQAAFEYDFALHGGAVGAITVGPKLLPAGALVFDGLIHVVTAVVGTTSTLAIHALSAEDILAATAEASLTLNSLHDTVCVGTAATSFRCTAATALTFTVAVNPLTAGKVRVYLRYFLSD